MEFPPLGMFRWKRKVSTQAPVQKPVFAIRNASRKRLRKAAQLVKYTPRDEEITKPNAKLAKRLTMTGTKNPHNITPMSEDITIASTIGIATTPLKSVGSPSTGSRDI
eukprot:11766840-Ditylum_brightwellii.AAC.1